MNFSKISTSLLIVTIVSLTLIQLAHSHPVALEENNQRSSQNSLTPLVRVKRARMNSAKANAQNVARHLDTHGYKEVKKNGRAVIHSVQTPLLAICIIAFLTIVVVLILIKRQNSSSSRGSENVKEEWV